jgi:hypothetical protein
MLKKFLVFSYMICLAGTTISAQPIVSNAVKKFPNNFSWTFEINDILRIQGATFARKIAAHQEPAMKCLWDHLPEGKRQFVLDYHANRFGADPKIRRTVDQQFCTNIVPELNALLFGALIYTEEYFPNNILEPDTRALLAQHPDGNALAHLNRMLLEDGFKELIAKSVRIVVDPMGNSYALVNYKSKNIIFYDQQNRLLSSIDVFLTLASRPGGLSNSFSDPDPQLKVRYSADRDGAVIAVIGLEGGSIDIKTGKFTYLGID